MAESQKLDGSAIVANTITGSKIQTGSITTLQLSSPIASNIAIGTHPKITSLTYPSDDTAANTGGGQTIIVRGTGFKNNVTIFVNGTAVPSVTFNNANAVSFTTAAQSAATYPLYLINTDDGATAILVPGIQYSGTPAWSTASALSDVEATSVFNIQLVATGDATIVYTLQTGSTLPSGITLAANGLISGTLTSPPSNETTYNFTVVATDPQNQDASRAFSVSVTVGVDDTWKNTVLLLNGDGTANGNNHAFVDSSNNAFTITRNGNASQGSFSPFSPKGWSTHIPDSSYFTSSTALLNISSSSQTFTAETWIFPTAFNTSGPGNYRFTSIMSKGIVYLSFGFTSGGVLRFYTYNNSENYINSASGIVQLNQWQHVAVVSNAGSITLYYNGNSVATGSLIVPTGGMSDAIKIGHADTNYQSDRFIGYMSNMRITNTAVYTTTFTPSTTAFTAITGTQFLTFQNNRFIDNSNNAYSITISGSPSIQVFSPFNTTTAYAPATYGGSAYFDGSGDYLTIADNAALELGSGDWTLECWYWQNVTNAYSALIGKSGTPAEYASYLLQINSTTPTFYLSTSGSSYAITISSSINITNNAWYHFAIVRSGNTITLYVNGVAAGSASYSSTPYDGSYSFAIGAYGNNAYPINGYVSNARLIKGTAVYTAAFTPPTAPLTNIANTSLLCNFTNAQIYDLTSGSVLETVGDAKVNTSIKKYGTGSIAFDGTGDYLALPANQFWNFNGSDWTIEMWLYPANVSGTKILLENTTGGTGGLSLQMSNAGILIYVSSSTSFGGTLTANTWQHIAVVRLGSTITYFLNGTSTGTATLNPGTGATGLWIGERAGGGVAPFNGYIDDLRITKGLGRYPYNFTPPTKALSNKGGTTTLTADPYFAYTTLLLPGNGTNNANNHAFVDSSTNNFTITRNGNASQGTFSPFSQTGWSNYFDGSGDYITTPANSAFSYGTGDFTVEAFVYTNANITNGLIVSNRSGGGTETHWTLEYYTTANRIEWHSGVTIILTSSVTTVPGTWNHIAVTRSGTSLKMFLNGVQVASATDSRNYSQVNAVQIGWEPNFPATPGYFNGYISNLRILKGTALYTSDFTPPTSALTAVANTSLLSCQSNRFIDNSTNAFTLTRNGDASVQAFSPFAPTAAYTTANVGGSMYLDGTGDYIQSTGITNQFDVGSAFTLELWAYVTALPADQAWWSVGGSTVNWSTATGIYHTLYYYNNILWWQTGVGNGLATVIISTTVPPLFAWNHIAIGYNGTTTRMWINGVSVGTSTTAYFKPSSTDRVTIGAFTGGTQATSGYFSGARFVKGSDVYGVGNASITVPTAPPTAIANTSLLCNFTNAGITDATGKNVLETVGDAKISTTQSKFGGSSMYFDGTGDGLNFRSNNLLTFGTGDYTIELWVYHTSLSGQQTYVGDTPGNTNGVYFYKDTSHKVGLYYTAQVLTGTTTLAINTWYHVAVSRFSGTSRLFVNGVQEASAADATNLNVSLLYVGIDGSSNPINGYIDDLRITKGIARYTQNFTPPTSAFLLK